MGETLATIALEAVDVLIALTVTSQCFQYSTGFKMIGYNLHYTHCIGYFEADIIASIEYPGKIPMFAYLSCFSK